MARARDVGAYLLSQGVQDRLELQKLLFYSQAWHLAWHGAPLFPETIRAWDCGPVVGEVWYELSRGGALTNASALTPAERETVDAVCAFYGTFSGTQLSELTHLERPWAEAWRPERPNPIIPLDAMRAYYGAIPCEGKVIPESYRRGIELLLGLPPEDLAALLVDHPTEATTQDAIAFLEGRETGPWLS
ncbi:MAG: SocA family protein [Deltaproteobacteria bacterium]|nr:SocA family protein [Deltaproteobacteria bacterium]